MNERSNIVSNLEEDGEEVKQITTNTKALEALPAETLAFGTRVMAQLLAKNYWQYIVIVESRELAGPKPCDPSSEVRTHPEEMRAIAEAVAAEYGEDSPITRAVRAGIVY